MTAGPLDWPAIWAMAERDMARSNGWQPGGAARLIESEREELVRLRMEVHRLTQRRGGELLWRPGQPMPEGLPDAVAADVESDYRTGVAQLARTEQQRRDARREVDSQGWQPPDGTAPLTAELALARTTYAYRIDSLAGWNHNVLVAGERKTGKTTLMVNLTAALSAACRAPDGTWIPGQFLGPWTKCWAAGSVAYWNAEMDADDWRDEFRRLPAAVFDPRRIFPLHFRGVSMPVITNPAARAWFVAWLREHGIETLIIDTWGQFCAQNGVRKPSDDGEVRPLLDGLDAIKRETGVASLFLLIHMPHQTGEKHLERFKGAGATGDWADTLWTYVKDAEGVRYLWAEGRARISWEETSLSWVGETGQLAWSYQGNRMQTARERQRDKAMKALEAAGERGLGAEDLKDAAGGNRAAAGEVIGRIVGDGLADMERNGRAKIYRLKDYRKQSQDQAQDHPDHED